MSKSSALALLFLAFTQLGSCTSPNHPPDRGTWWYLNGNGMNPDPAGSEQVILNAASLEEVSAAADAIKSCKVKRVYASYGKNIEPVEGSVTPAGDNVAHFNEALHFRGMQSQVLFSEGVSQLADWSNLLAKVQSRVIDFNAAVPAVNRFDGVHLDIEPHGGSPSACKVASLNLADCRALFGTLLDLITDVRTLIDASGQPLQLYVDLPEWANRVLPESNVRIGWAGTGDRDAWFDALDLLVDGVSIFAYADDDLSSIAEKVQWETTNMTSEVRVSLDIDYDTSASNTWSAMDSMANALEFLGYVVDLHSTNELQSQTGFTGCGEASGPGGPGEVR